MNDNFNNEYKGAAEYGRNASEFSGGTELQPVRDNFQAEEYGVNTEGTAVGPKKKKKSSSSSKLTSFTVALAAVATVAVATTAPSSSVSAEISEYAASNTSISYCVEAETGDRPLKIVLYNDFTRREALLTSGSNAGEFTELHEDMEYTVAVVGNFGFGEKNIDERKIRTLRSDEMPVTAFRSITHECTCDVDGFFHFALDFIDENGFWSDFGATLTDSKGNIARCDFGDPSDRQKIDVAGNDLLGTSALFEVYCTSYENSERGERIVLYSAEVAI